MIDRVSSLVLPNGAIRYGEYDETGAFLRYVYYKPEDAPSEVGTPINKATLFTDATAALYGLTGDAATPNNAFNMLGAYATCSAAGSTAAKVAVQSGFTRAVGTIVRVIFTTTNTAASPTLNVNNTGAAAIQYAGAALSSPGMISAKIPHLFLFDGTYWQLLNPSAGATTVVGTYTGNNTNATDYSPRLISLGFTPRAVFVWRPRLYHNDVNTSAFKYQGLAVTGSLAGVASDAAGTVNDWGKSIEITTNGFNVRFYSNGGDQYAQTNESGKVYNYIAFK